MTSPRNYTTVLLLTIFLGPLGIHRFWVGKVGTGIVYLFSYGLFLIGWIADIVTVASGRFTDSQGRAVKRATGPGGSRAGLPEGMVDHGLEFVVDGKEPERDDEGRVVVRLGNGSQFQIPVHWVDGVNIDPVTDYLAGSKELSEGDEGTVTKRFRLDPVISEYWGGKCFRLATPDGVVAFEIRDHFEDRFGLTSQILRDTRNTLVTLHPSLATEAFVFDVSVRAHYTVEDGWGDGGDGDGGDAPEVIFEDVSVRLRNPLKIQVRSATG
jgi:hypothetical protein